jgi:SAM-dependent methyltransferase
MDLDKKFWNQKYEKGETGWDAGTITRPIKEYIDQVKNKDLKILIPGCGNGHEAEYFINQGFKNTFVADISDMPLQNLKARCHEFPQNQLLLTDFFTLDLKFDLIIEQTFFCALNPEIRPKYAEKMFSLLEKGGKLVGLLFDDKLNSDHPPFGGTKEEYISYFRPYFEIKYFDKCYNSIKPREGRELFICLVKKN